MRIRLSEKYGLNPSLGQCFYCGEDYMVILFGQLGEEQRKAFGSMGGEAPRKVCMGPAYSCPKCKELMERGVILVSVRDGEEGENPYRTGRLAVIEMEAIRRICTPEMAEALEKARFAFVPDSDWAAIGLPTEEVPLREPQTAAEVVV